MVVENKPKLMVGSILGLTEKAHAPSTRVLLLNSKQKKNGVYVRLRYEQERKRPAGGMEF